MFFDCRAFIDFSRLVQNRRDCLGECISGYAGSFRLRRGSGWPGAGGCSPIRVAPRLAPVRRSLPRWCGELRRAVAPLTLRNRGWESGDQALLVSWDSMMWQDSAPSSSFGLTGQARTVIAKTILLHPDRAQRVVPARTAGCSGQACRGRARGAVGIT